MADDNPFADPASINPFADPAVTAATNTVPAEDEYNPFSEDNKQTEPEPIRLPPPPTKAELKAEKDKEKAAKAAKEKEKKEAKKREREKAKKTFEPAIMEPEEPPEYTPAPSSFNRREDEELRKREEEIARREQDLQDREKNIERLGSGDIPKNFPPFPTFCPSPLKPCFYISVKTEIPPSEQWKMYALLALLIYLWVLLVINLVLAIAGAVVAGTENNPNLAWYLTTMGISIVYLVLFAPGAFFCWFLPAYYAYKKDSSLAFMWFFFVMAFQILSFLLGAIGPPNLGACGWYNGGLLFQVNNGTTSPTAGQVAIAVMFIITGFLWFLGTIPSILVLILVHKYYRSSGGSINKAVTEGVSGAAKNDAVRGAMKSTVKAGVKTALSADEK